jgi:hypothetical protein
MKRHLHAKITEGEISGAPVPGGWPNRGPFRVVAEARGQARPQARVARWRGSHGSAQRWQVRARQIAAHRSAGPRRDTFGRGDARGTARHFRAYFASPPATGGRRDRRPGLRRKDDTGGPPRGRGWSAQESP